MTTVPAKIVAKWPGVRRADTVDGRLVLMSDHAETTLRRLLDADPQLGELEVQRAGLAEAFVAMTASADATTGSNQQEAA